jgi:hypothetical protein
MKNAVDVGSKNDCFEFVLTEVSIVHTLFDRAL